MDPELPFALVQAECVILIWLDLAASRRKVITIFLVLAKHAEYRRAEAFWGGSENQEQRESQ
jgi:hypothetical protein